MLEMAPQENGCVLISIGSRPAEMTRRRQMAHIHPCKYVAIVQMSLLSTG